MTHPSARYYLLDKKKLMKKINRIFFGFWGIGGLLLIGGYFYEPCWVVSTLCTGISIGVLLGKIQIDSCVGVVETEQKTE